MGLSTGTEQVSTLGEAGEARPTPWPFLRPATARRLVGVVGGLSVAGAGYGLTASGRTPGAASLLVLLLLLAVTPVARTLPARLSVNGAFLVGWVPLLWFVSWPVPLNHGAAVVGCWAGALVTFVVWTRGWRRLLPDVRVGDLLLLVAVVLSAVVMAPWWRARSPQAALEALLPAWDNAAHFSMFASARSHGAVLAAVGPSPDGSRWAYADYPQGFHALVATLSELTMPGARTGPVLLVSYAQMTSVVVGLGALLLAGSLLSLPGLRSRPCLAAPAIAFAGAAYFWEPGQRLIADGFANFWLAAVAAASALLIAVSSRRRSVAGSAAVAGLIVAVVQAWTPLAVFAAPAAVVVSGLRPWRIPMVPRPRRLLLLAPWAVLGLVAARTGATLLSAVPVSAVVDAAGGIHGTSPIPTFVLAVAGTYVFVSYRGWVRMRGNPDLEVLTGDRVARLALLPAVGVPTLALFLFVQLTRTGSTAYYFLKLLMGFELIMAAVTAGVVAMLLAATTAPWRRGWPSLAGTVSATLVASQAFGLVPLHQPPLRGYDSLVPVLAPYSRSGIAESLLAASSPLAATGGFDHAYVAVGRGGTPQLGLANQWFHALTESSTLRELRRSEPLAVFADPTVDGVLPAVRALLRRRPEVVVVVDPRRLERLRSRLGSPGLEGRLVGWS